MNTALSKIARIASSRMEHAVQHAPQLGKKNNCP
jgi:2-oxo-4-hydroxy-4-carboxy--5-ureidoimidazoline (OHCU) decarboxylase